jgi:hypothetical protein
MKYKSTLLAFISMFPISVLAADLYVSPTGNNANLGTSSDAPLLTIVKASELAKPGTIIHVAPGNYAGGFQTKASGTAGAPIRYVSDKKWGAKIVGSGGGKIWHNYGNYVIVDGFELTGAGKTHGLISGPPSTGGDLGHHFTATNNYVHDMAVDICGSGGAITGFSPTGYSIITNNVIRNIAVSLIGSCATQQGIYISDSNSYIANNIISGVAAVGIHQWHGATRSIIVNNTVFNNVGGIGVGGGDSGVLPNGSQDNYVANNIVAHNEKWGITEYGKTSRNTFHNNLLYNNPKNVMSGSGSVVSGTITTNPMFIDYQANGSGDYRLESNSPAIDKGTMSASPAIDFDGTARPQGAGIDIGAYEVKKSTSTSAIAKFSTNALNFANLAVGSMSPALPVTISSSGSAPLIISNFKASGDFSILNSSTCAFGKAYASGSSCVINVSFAPIASGVRVGSLSVETNSQPALSNIALSGSGVAEVKAPKISLSTSSLNLGSVNLGSTSASNIVTITNSGNAPLIFSNAFSMTGDFASASSGTCKVSVSINPGQSCMASVVFKPTVAGVRSGILSIASNASSSSSIVNLSGTGVALKSSMKVSVSNLSFGQVRVGSRSVIKEVIITNTGAGALVFSQGFTFTGKFTFGGTGTCKTNVSYAQGKSCTASVVFQPTAKGAQQGVLSIQSNDQAVKVDLTGTGI